MMRNARERKKFITQESLLHSSAFHTKQQITIYFESVE